VARPLPDYGSPPSDSSWQQAALLVPRLALAPLYVTGDLVAQPLIAAGTFAEKHHVRERLHDFFTFGPERSLALYPIVWIDFGFRPSAGARFSWNPPRRADRLWLRVTTGGANWWSASGTWLLPLGGHQLKIHSSFTRREDAAYYGSGGASVAQAARYGEQGWDSWLDFGMPLAPGLSLTSSLLHQWWRFEPDPASASRSLASALAAGELSPPPALAGGLLAVGSGLRLEYDNRRGRVSGHPHDASDLDHLSGSGVAVRVQLIEQAGLRRTRAEASDMPRLPAWLSSAASATGTLDLTGTQRRLELELYAACADPLPGAGEVPFTEQVSLGGAKPMPGFASRRLVDRSAAVAALRYRWPIWSELDGMLEYAVGNVFGPHWRGLGLEDARTSFALGIATAAASNHVFELLVAAGSETLGTGGQLESLRLAAGWNAGF
jgi:hypothetical protein